jgi:predicted phage tail protein
VGEIIVETSPTNSINFTGLKIGVQYTFTVSARNSVGISPASIPSPGVKAVSVPNPPTNPSAIINAPNVTLHWYAPNMIGAMGLINYIITSYINGIKNSTISTGSNTTSYTVSDLLSGIPYRFTIIAVNAIGNSNESSPTSVITLP